MKSLVNPTLTCPASEDVDNDCSLHDPMAVVVGVPSLDCADDAYQGTDEIHPVLAMAIRIKEPTLQDLQNPQNLQNPQPEKWAFFYRQHGDTGPCGGANYSRCLSNFKLPIGLPVVPANAVLTGADVHVEWHKWADETFGSGSADISVCGSTSDSSGAGSIDCANSFDLINGTVLNIHLPHNEDGVVGLVTVTPHYDTTPPTITCPANITKPADPGKCTAAVTFAPMAADNCAVNSVVCNTPSGSAFPVGTTTDTCTATDQAGQTASCSFNVTVVDNQPPMISNMSVSPTTLSPPNHKIVDVAVNYTASDNCGAVTCALSGTSNEPDNGMGDGDTPNDIMPIDSHNIGLRAERSGRGNGRLYTITNTCTDAHANSTTATATVSVPKGK
ncbi:MAG TPA: HYR domain-containing protein [Chthoniobacterales bacterium]|nr:HYR domain-containing protein [Chthoniobacterales bacterium]